MAKYLRSAPNRSMEISIITAFLVMLILSMMLLFLPHRALSQVAPTSIAGYAWSDNIGWIDLNCSNTNSCGTLPFGLSVNGSGIISGYAWSDNIGWISSQSSDLAGCPSGPCVATLTSGALSGWFKAVSADNNGWDGWISLSGANYGPKVTNGLFTGFTWGSDVVGAIDFSSAYTPCTPSTTYSCTGPGNQTIASTTVYANCQVYTNYIPPVCGVLSFCVNGSSQCQYATPIGSFTVTPLLVIKGHTVQVSWQYQHVQHCQVTADANTDSWSCADAASCNTANTHTTSKIMQTTTYTLSCLEDDGVTNYTQTATVGLVPTYQER